MSYVCGLDLAKSHDHSALVLVDPGRREITAAIRFAHMDYVQQIKMMLPFLEKCSRICIDATGVGKAAFELFPPALPLWPVTMTGGDQLIIRPSRAVSIGKSALIKCLMSSGLRVAENCPGRDELKKEMLDFAYGATKTGKVTMNARRNHDDLVVAASLASLAIIVNREGNYAN